MLMAAKHGVRLSCANQPADAIFAFWSAQSEPVPFAEWRGYLVAGFSLVAVANLYMSLFGRLRGEIEEEKVVTALAEAGYRRQPSGPPPGDKSALSAFALFGKEEI